MSLRDVFCVHRTAEGDAAALGGMTLEVGERELVAVIGPSGSGKSTLLRVIAGLQTPSAGEAAVLGLDIGRMRAADRSRLRHQQIGFLDQRSDSVLPPELPITESLALPLALRGQARAAQRDRASQLLEEVGLEDRGDALPEQLSGGERQRVALCVALAHRPRLLLADEPTGELDAANGHAIRALITRLVRSHGATAVIVSHDAGTAAGADRVVRIRDGRVVRERREGEDALVVGHGGWVQLPSELLARAGIHGRARIRSGRGALVLTAAEPKFGARKTAAGDGTPAAFERAPAKPVGVQLQRLVRYKGRRASRRRVIDELDHDFVTGGLTIVIGSSGSGKSTLLSLIAGLEQPEQGAVLIDGLPLTNLDLEQLAKLRRTRIGYLPQEPTPIGFLSAEENVALALRLRGLRQLEAGHRALAALERVGLAQRRRQRVARLSAGEAQRVALARAIASADGLLVVDEPTSRLDEANARMVGEVLCLAARNDGQTVICASHDEQLCHRADAVLSLEG